MSTRLHQIADLGGTDPSLKVVAVDGSNNDVLVTPDELIGSASVSANHTTHSFEYIETDLDGTYTVNHSDPNDVKVIYFYNDLAGPENTETFIVTLDDIAIGSKVIIDTNFMSSSLNSGAGVVIETAGGPVSGSLMIAPSNEGQVDNSPANIHVGSIVSIYRASSGDFYFFNIVSNIPVII